MEISNVTNNDKVNSTASGTGNVSAASSSQKSDSASILTTKKPKEELLKQLGITVEQYLEICTKNPNFETLSLEKQLEYISKQSAPKSETPQPQSAQTADAQSIPAAKTNTAASTTQAQAAQASSSQNPAVKTEEVKDIDSKADAPQTETQAEESPFFNKAEFVKKTPEEKIKIYINEYAKNAFMFADSENPKTEEDWAALSDKEKAKYLKTATGELNLALGEALQATKSDATKNIALDVMMTDLLVAKQNGLTLKQLYGIENIGKDDKIDANMREEMVYSYLNEVDLIEKDMNCPSSLSAVDRARLENERLLAEAVGDKYGEENMCPGTARRYLDKNLISEYEIELQYLQKKSGEGELTEFEQKKLLELQELVQDPAFNEASKESQYQKLENFKVQREEALKNGDTSKVAELDKIINSDAGKDLERWAETRNIEPVEMPAEFEEFKESPYGKIYTAANDPKLKSAILAAYVEENADSSKEKTELYLKFLQGLQAEGSLATRLELTKFSMFEQGNSAVREAITEKGELNAVTTAYNQQLRRDSRQVSRNQTSTVTNRAGLEVENANTVEAQSAAIKKATNVLKTVQRFGDDNQKRSAVDGTTSATDNAEVLKSTVDVGNSINDKDLQLEAHKAIAAKRVADVNVYAVRNLQHSHTDNQVPALELYTENCPEAIEVSAKEGIYVTLDSKNQIKAKSLIDKRVDENFEGQEKIDLLNKSNDFICEADVENQLALHEMAMNSKYDEVVEHASSNIYTYDESVQADAIKASYNTGNQKAIDAVNAQLDKCSPKAVEAVGSDVISRQTQATESRYTKEVAQQVAEFNQKYQELTGTAAQDNILPDADEQKMAFVQNFLSATPQEQYKLLSKIPQAWQGTVFSKICQYCPTLLTGLVKQGYGKQILKTPGMPSDVIYKVINTMLTCGAKDKKDASKYVLDHKYLFTESTLERCEEILNGVKGRERKNYSSKPIGGGIQAALQPGMSAIYPDKMDMFYKA